MKPLRLQDGFAGALAAIFAAGLCATTWHLAVRFDEVRDDTLYAAGHLGELPTIAAEGLGPHTVSAIEARIDGTQEELRRQQARHDAAARDQDAADSRRRAATRQAAEGGLLGLGPYSAGPPPDTWGPRILYRDWWKWRAKKKLADTLNQQYRKHTKAFTTAKAVVEETRSLVRALGQDIARLRDLKNATVAALRDPVRRDELVAAARSSETTRFITCVLHVPIAFYFALLFVRTMFRLAILREWIGPRRLSRAH